MAFSPRADRDGSHLLSRRCSPLGGKLLRCEDFSCEPNKGYFGISSKRAWHQVENESWLSEVPDMREPLENLTEKELLLPAVIKQSAEIRQDPDKHPLGEAWQTSH